MDLLSSVVFRVPVRCVEGGTHANNASKHSLHTPNSNADFSLLAFIEPIMTVQFALVVGLLFLVNVIFRVLFLMLMGAKLEYASATRRLLEAPFGFFGHVAHDV